MIASTAASSSGLLRLFLLLRRHVAVIELIENLLPKQRIIRRLDVVRESVETPIPLLFLRAMALDAILA